MHLDDFAIVDLARDYHLHVECKAKTFHRLSAEPLAGELLSHCWHWAGRVDGEERLGVSRFQVVEAGGSRS